MSPVHTATQRLLASLSSSFGLCFRLNKILEISYVFYGCFLEFLGKDSTVTSNVIQV